MRWQDVKTYRDRKPFVPFRIVFTDGRVIDIPHPDYLFVTPHIIDIAVSVHPQSGVPTETIIAAPVHIVRLEYLQPVPEEG